MKYAAIALSGTVMGLIVWQMMSMGNSNDASPVERVSPPQLTVTPQVEPPSSTQRPQPSAGVSGRHELPSDSRPEAMRGRIERVREVLVAAQNDFERVHILITVLRNAAMSGGLSQGKRVLEETEYLVSDPRAREWLAREVDRQTREEEARRSHSPTSEMEAERARLRGRLDHLRDRLADAKGQGKPPEDVRSLERIVAELERQVQSER